MGHRLLPEAFRALFAVEPDPKFCAEPGRPALFLNRPKEVAEDDVNWLDDEAQVRLKKSVKDTQEAELRVQRKQEESARYLAAKLFPPDDHAPTLRPATPDPTARPARRTMTTGGPVSDVARGVAIGYLNEKLRIANKLLKRLQTVRLLINEQVCKMSSGVQTNNLEYPRLLQEVKDIKFQLNKVSKSVRITNGEWMQYQHGTINVLLMSYVGDIAGKCVDVTSQLSELIVDGGVKGQKLNLRDLGVDLSAVDDESLTIIFMGKSDIQESSISKHHTGLTWTPKFKQGVIEEVQVQNRSTNLIPTRDISEGDVVLRDLFNGFSDERQMEHKPFMTSKITDVELDMMKYEANGLMCCRQEAPPTIALFYA